jgi:hypothetical protein
VNLLLFIAAVNLCGVFFVYGGYDVWIGPVHLHGYSISNYLLLCLILAGVKGWLRCSRLRRSPMRPGSSGSVSFGGRERNMKLTGVAA